MGRVLASAALAVSGAAVKAVNMVAIPAAALFKSEAAAELDAAASAASEFAAAAGGHPTLSLTVQLEPVSCLEAAIGAGLTPAAAQTCLAMLAEPGGLVSGGLGWTLDGHWCKVLLGMHCCLYCVCLAMLAEPGRQSKNVCVPSSAAVLGCQVCLLHPPRLEGKSCHGVA